MKTIALMIALLLPVAASATQAPVDVIEAEAQAAFVQIASAPTLPFVPADQATACAMSVDPLPTVLALAGAGSDTGYLTFCFSN